MLARGMTIVFQCASFAWSRLTEQAASWAMRGDAAAPPALGEEKFDDVCTGQDTRN